MAGKDRDQVKAPKLKQDDITSKSQSLTDDEIITEKRLPRRSFLAVGGTLLAAGALVLTSGRVTGAQDDPDKKKPAPQDPDKAKQPPASDPDKAKATSSSDPDKAKTKSDKKKSKTKPQDPDKAKAPASDPDKAKQPPAPDPDKPKP
jgi:hypothetical protein